MMKRHSSHRQFVRLSVFLTLLSTSLMLTGCALSGSVSGSSDTSSGALHTTGLSGSVIGGQNPVNGAKVQLYQIGVGTGTSYTANAIPLISSTVTTDAHGAFTITGLYTCVPGTYLYLTAAGGDPGLGTGVNPNSTLMASVGLCDNLTPQTFIAVNEVTTVATAYAFAQFARVSDFGQALSTQNVSDPTPAINIATSSTNVQGIANAAAMANVLADPVVGTSPGTNGNGSLTNPLVVSGTGGSTGAVAEFWQINTIADILGACVNSAGGNATDTSTSCGTLFANVLPLAGTNPSTGTTYAAPADTAQAALYLALTPTLPTANIQALYAKIPATAPFTPYVTSAASIVDFTVGVNIQPVIPGTSTTLIFEPTWTAADSNGNIWVSNQSLTGTHPASLLELSPTGVPLRAGTATGSSASNYLINTYTMNSTTTNYLGQFEYITSSSSYEAASAAGTLTGSIDTNNNVWIPDRASDSVVKIPGSGGKGAGTAHNGGNAGDVGGNGAVGYKLASGAAPMMTVVDGSNNVWTMLGAELNGVAASWVTGSCGTSYSTYNMGLVGFLGGDPTRGAYSPTTYTNKPFSMAIDPNINDTVTPSGGSATAIPGAPFIWTPASNILYHQYTGGTNPGCATPLSAFSQSGNTTPIPGQIISGTDIAYPIGASTYDVAFDSTGHIWISRPGAIDTSSTVVSAIVKMLPAYGTAFTPAQAEANTTFTYYYNEAGLSSSYNARVISVDGDGNVWFVFNNGGKAGAISNTGVALSPVNSGGTPGFTGSTCTSCKYNGETAQTYLRSTLSPHRVSFDLSGNVWMAMGGTNSTSLLVLVGAAGPTVSPNSLGLSNKTLATRP